MIIVEHDRRYEIYWFKFKYIIDIDYINLKIMYQLFHD